MALTFAPGDVNSPACVDQKLWKNHRLVVYGSGNNVIILLATEQGNEPHPRNSLQTVYAERDVTAVAINAQNGLIIAAYGAEIVLLRPVNEYMATPKWLEAARAVVGKSGLSVGADSAGGTSGGTARDARDNHVICARWAPAESELVCGTRLAVLLLHVQADYASAAISCRWQKLTAGPVGMVDISPDSSKIIAYNTLLLDSFAKVWMRITYGENTLFELAYADHSPESWVVAVKWRGRAVDKKAMDLDAMANIRDLRTFMPNFLAAEENCILYTVTSDHVFHVWATCDFNGHNYLKLWAHVDLLQMVLEYRTCIVVDQSPESDDIGSDLFLVVGHSESCLVQISNLNHNPPNSIVFKKLAVFPTGKSCLPSMGAVRNATPLERIRLQHNYIRCSDAVFKNGNVFFICSDAVKQTLRSVKLDVTDPKSPALALQEKYLGHSKSVARLFTSSTSYSGNILLSVLRFSDENYIWEPVPVKKDIAISKRFCINIGHENRRILSAVLINDIFPASKGSRRHLAATLESGGYISFWDCNGETMDELDAEMIQRLDIMQDGDRLVQEPRAFFLEKVDEMCFVVIAVYSPEVSLAWKITRNLRGRDVHGADSLHGMTPLLYTPNPNAPQFSILPLSCSALPGEYAPGTKISNISTFLEKDLSVIDENGLLRLLSVDLSVDSVGWKETCRIHTNVRNPTFIHGASLIGKVAIIDGLQLTIWDCSSGVLEYEETFPEESGAVRDLDWTFIGDKGSTANAILSVGFSRVVLLYTQLRYDYTNRMPTFAVLKRIDISDYTAHEIGDLIWLDDHYLVISSGNQFFIEDGRIRTDNPNSPIDSTVQELLLGYTKKESPDFPLSDVVRILNGPLPVYHPQFLIQALLMDEGTLVRMILVRLLQKLRQNSAVSWNLGLEAVDILSVQDHKNDDDVFSSFSEIVVDLLLEKLALVSLPLITRHQQSTLSTVVKMVLHAAQYTASLDQNGLKFVYSFELFENSPKQRALNTRDILWALHSDQKEMLYSLLEKVYHRFDWGTICTTGIVYWVDRFRLENTLDSVARNEFADARDPSGRISVLYLALNKKQVLIGLWKTVSHPEKAKMLKFLGNDFSQARWKSAAAKNAFVLLGKHRYLDAASFFLLAGQTLDCCMILCSKMQDIELALAVARVSDDASCVQTIIEQYVLPKAVQHGDRWMASWAFWQMKQKAWSIQALLQTPYSCVQAHITSFSQRFQDDFKSLHFVPESASFLRDDPVLGVLYSNLRLAKLTYHTGAMEISAQTEFDYVVKLANTYSRMGCDYLSVMLLTRWRFLTEKKEEAKENAAFSEFSVRQNLAPVSHEAAFVEPDMSAFDFGF